MRISRKYEWFGALYEDDLASKEAIDEAFTRHHIPPETQKELIECNYYIIPSNMNIENGIPGMCYRDIMDRFAVLDKTDPYDNGLAFDAVSRIEHFTRSRGKSVQLFLINQPAEMPYRIIGIVTLECADTRTGYRLTKPWH